MEKKLITIEMLEQNLEGIINHNQKIYDIYNAEKIEIEKLKPNSDYFIHLGKYSTEFKDKMTYEYKIYYRKLRPINSKLNKHYYIIRSNKNKLELLRSIKNFKYTLKFLTIRLINQYGFNEKGAYKTLKVLLRPYRKKLFQHNKNEKNRIIELFMKDVPYFKYYGEEYLADKIVNCFLNYLCK